MTDIRDISSEIKEIIGRFEIKNQTQLQALLEDRGVKLNQSTISRTLKRLKVKKDSGTYALRKMSSQEKSLLSSGEGSSLLGIQTIEATSPNLVVIKTLPGIASRAAYLIDKSEIKDIAGTIAGDDTIFVAVKNQVNLTTLFEKLNNTLGLYKTGEKSYEL